jgi:DNA uptake protein ComE-like DNA-binding protein
MGRVKLSILAAGIVALAAAAASAQPPQPPPAKSAKPGLLDANIANEKELATVPHVTPAIAKAIVSKRPLATVIVLDQLLAEHKLTPEQIAEVHGRLFVPLNLNSATDQEILAIPGIGNRMLREFKEYRPYRSMEQFRREIGKYIDRDKREAELARLEQYVKIG